MRGYLCLIVSLAWLFLLTESKEPNWNDTTVVISHLLRAVEDADEDACVVELEKDPPPSSPEGGKTDPKPNTDPQSNTDECKDRVPLCSKIKKHCKTKKMMDVLNTNCPDTCGLCSAKCQDTSRMCKSWQKNDFCGSAIYLEGVKREKCALTCKLCHPNTAAEAKKAIAKSKQATKARLKPRKKTAKRH